MSARRLLPFVLLWIVCTVGGMGIAGAYPLLLTETESERVARAHLRAHAADYGLNPTDIDTLRLESNHTVGDGAHILKFTQTHNGIAVDRAQLTVLLLKDGNVWDVGNRAVPHPTMPFAEPRLTQRDAIVRAAHMLALPYTAESVTLQAEIGGAAREMHFSGGDLSLEPIPVKLLYYPLPDGTVRLAWALNIYQYDMQHWWDVRIDAQTGDLLTAEDWVIHDDWGALAAKHAAPPSGTITTFAAYLVTPRLPALVGTYRVYALPTESPSHSDPPTPADGRVLAANPDSSIASPFGWHDTDGIAGAEFTRTQGNNAHAFTDTDSNGIPDPGSDPDGGAGLLFDFPIDLTQPPSAYPSASVTNLFYWTNVIHDIAYLYGFDEVAGNMQENNYGNGGLGSDYLYAEAQEGIGTNGGTISVPPDGQNPRMQMFIWTATTPRRDGALDAGVIVHEYGHAISLRTVGIGCLNNAEAMGEGWSDWHPLMLTMRPGDTGATPRGVATYLMGQPPDGAGIRPAPYSTDFAINDYTYADLPAAAGSHGVGFIWNTMLWEMNWELIQAHGFNPTLYDTPDSGGNNLAYQLVQTALELTPCLPGMVDGRNAILSADQVETGGENQCLIWAAFARRGLGVSASQGSPTSTTDGTPAFDLPPECPVATPTPTATQASTFTPTPTAPVPTLTPTPTCCTPVPPTFTATPTSSTVTPTPPTVTPTVPTATPTVTPVPTITPTLPTSTPTVLTATPTASITPAVPTITPIILTATATPTGTPTAFTATPTIGIPTVTPGGPSVTPTPTVAHRLFLPLIDR